MANMNNLKPIQSLRPFTRFCCTIGNLPSSYMVSLTYEEQLLWLCNYLENTVIPTINQNAEAVTELQNLYIELKNYFNNLDVQTEINNKLDEMVTDGTLDKIINQEIFGKINLQLDNTTLEVDTTTQLLTMSPSLNRFYQTHGYYQINDGGGCLFYVTNIESLSSIKINDNLYLEPIIYSNECNPLIYGAYHDNVNEDTTAIQKCLNLLHENKCKILDLKGFTYLINDNLKLDSCYKCTIKNGYIISNNFNIDTTNPENNYLLTTTNVINSLQPGSFGYSIEDLYIENVTFDAFNQENLGCLYFNAYFRVRIFNCDFRRYKTYGVITSSASISDGHEMEIANSYFRAKFNNETNSTGIGIYITKHDGLYTNLIIVGGAIGIETENEGQSYCSFSKIHIYDCSEYAIKINKTPYLSFEQIYFDGCGLYLCNPWQTIFSNCNWFGNVLPITLDQTGGNQLLGLKFIGCFANLLTPANLITHLNGALQNAGQNSFDFTGTNLTNNSSPYVLTQNYNVRANDTIRIFNNIISGITRQFGFNNLFNINSQNQALALGANGTKINNTAGNTNYTYTIEDNIIKITNYNTAGYTWLGFVIALPKNTNIRMTNKYNYTNSRFKIIGFNSLTNGTVGTELKAENTDQFIQFNTGNYDYYVISIFDRNTLDIEALTVLS